MLLEISLFAIGKGRRAFSRESGAGRFRGFVSANAFDAKRTAHAGARGAR
ncbi:hypothetical protein ACWJKU_17040 [Methylocaldum sp. MU1018]